jgi:phosphoserine phosphatase RsbU/P
MATLTALKGKGVNRGAVIPLDGERVVLGRNADCGVVINEPAVSREHACVRRLAGKFYIEDLKSRNYTYVNDQKIESRTLLKDFDRIKICDNVFEFLETPPRPPLPEEMRRGADGQPEEDEESSSTVEATLSHSSKRIFETQPAEKLAFLLDISGDLTQTFDVNLLLPKIVDSLFHVFKHADRGFVILAEEGLDRLVPKVIKTRRQHDESSARFSRRIVYRCLESGEAVLSEDASADKRFDLSQSIADCKIRSVMCAPLVGRTNQKAFGVIQLDTQDRSKKFSEDDLKLLLAVAGQSAIALENAGMHESLVASAALQRDLKLARQVQLGFLPKKPPAVEGYEFCAHYEAAEEVGGDYYDFIPIPDRKVAVMLGDVAGKGVAAALLMAKVSSDARFLMLTERTPADAVAKLNDQMQEAGLLDRFVTLIGAVLDAVTHQVTFVNAGHLPALVYRKATGKVTEATPRDLAGFPLGVAEGIPFGSHTVTLSPGDGIVLFTDGVTDAKGKQGLGHDFGLARAVAALEAGPGTPKAMVPRLMAAVKQFAQGAAKQFDDITVVAFGRQV